jgi:hypothetical protein
MFSLSHIDDGSQSVSHSLNVITPSHRLSHSLRCSHAVCSRCADEIREEAAASNGELRPECPGCNMSIELRPLASNGLTALCNAVAVLKGIERRAPADFQWPLPDAQLKQKSLQRYSP